MADPLDPLDPRSLLSLLSATAPSVHGSSALPHPTDAAAGLVHAIHTALGFRLVPSTPTQGQQAPSSAYNDDDAASTTATAGTEDDDDARSETTTAVDPDETPDVDVPRENVLPATWNARGEDSYMFEYRHEQSAMTFRVRVGRMGQRIQVDAAAEVSCVR